MNTFRIPSQAEIEFIAAMLRNSSEGRCLIPTLDRMQVKTMDDGGMGSLLLMPKEARTSDRRLGHQIVLGEVIDKDGVPVSAAVNVDQDGQLFELDMWKVDFSPLVQWPDATGIRIVNPNGPDP